MPAKFTAPTFTLIGAEALYAASPKWEIAEAFIQALLHKHKNIRSHAARREAAFGEMHTWIRYAHEKGAKK